MSMVRKSWNTKALDKIHYAKLPWRVEEDRKR